MNKICVYTCITGNYDNIKELPIKEKNIDYYCFTNNKNLKSNTWNIIYIEDTNLSNVKLARKIKILGHPMINEKYDILLWMDGSVTFNKSIKEFINTYLHKSDNFVAFKHSQRDNIKDECLECVKKGKEEKNLVKELLKFYQKENYNFDNGLIESTVYIKRPKDKLVQETSKIWFDMVNNYSKRDQLSFNYAISKTGLKVKWINKKVFDNEWFTCVTHNYEKEIKKYRIYFEDIDNKEYNMDNDIHDNLLIKDNKYIIDVLVPCNTKKIVVELSKIPFIMLKELTINGKNDINVHYFNSVKVDNDIFFYNDNPAFEFYEYNEKNKNIKIEMKLEILSDYEITKIFEYIEKEHINELTKYNDDIIKHNDVIDELQKENNKLNLQLNNILNSKSWKCTQKIRKVLRRK